MPKRNVDRKSNGGNWINRGGAPKGNLNASKSCMAALKRVMRGLELPPRLQRITQLSDMEADDLAADKGGLEYMSAGERSMLQNWKLARQCTLLILHELVERGAIQAQEDGSWDLQPGLARLGLFLAQERAALLALGLARRPKEIDLARAMMEAER